MASQLALPPPAAPRREPAEPIEPELKLSKLLKLTLMAARPLPEADALLRTATTLILSVDRAMDRLLSLLPTAAWPPAQLGPEPEPEPEPDRAEDIAIQQPWTRFWSTIGLTGLLIQLKTMSQNRENGR
ncbi:hypothetical protein B7463_g12428, partial [Scytalidium lignicola]